MKLSVVIPCLNESDTIATCVENAVGIIAEMGIEGEVIVADNGSTDGSPALAVASGARVVAVAGEGYGRALMGGIKTAKGRFIIIGDADDSYDFRQIPLFLDKLLAGNDLVQGCRMPSGGGKILPGAMPFLHRWLGNPMFSFMARWWFHAPVHDVNCGMRGFTRDLYLRLNQRCAGMEFATEMVIKASLLGARISEVPIALRPDGRKNAAPHLKTFRDGWETLWVFVALKRAAMFTPEPNGITRISQSHGGQNAPSSLRGRN